jgi:hypothetical protein
MKQEKPFYPVQALFNASRYLREESPRTRGVQQAIWEIESAKMRLEIAILKERIEHARQRIRRESCQESHSRS